MEWLHIDINKNMIKAQTGRAVLIAMPHSSDYDGYKFWHPEKLIRSGRNSASVSLAYTKDFTFTLKKYGNGRFNSREVINEIEISGTEFSEIMADIDGNITAPADDAPLIHRPPIVEPEPTEAIEELIDSD